jgi:hypothetical protein
MAAKLFAEFKGGKPCCAATILRWMHTGHRLRDGRVVRLEYMRLGTRMMTSRPAILRFVRAQQPQQQEVAASA